MTEILLAAYNGEKYLRAQLDSILAQTLSDWHLTVSDDGSSDATPSILDEYAARFPRQIRRVFPPRRFGSAKEHFFWLMRQSDADYLLFSDQDDVWHPDKLQLFTQSLQAAERESGKDTPVLVFSDLRPVDEELRPIAESLAEYQNMNVAEPDWRGILLSNVVTGCACGVNRALALLAAPPETDGIIMHDWWLAAVAARFGRLVFLPERTVDYRQHGDNSVGAKDVRSARYLARKLARLSSVRELAVRKKRQAAAFRQAYASRLSPEDAAFLAAFTKPHSGPLFYLRHRRLIRGLPRLAGMMVLG